MFASPQQASPSAPAAIDGGLSRAAFAARLDRLGPFEPRPRLAIAVSGGADSMALAFLARDWAQDHDGAVLALIVDHGLRADSAQEASLTQDRLRHSGLTARILSLDLQRGPALAARARAARLSCLIAEARREGIVHLLLGHHAGDQAETWVIRARAGSGPAGLAGIAALREANDVRLVRPLLDIPKNRLRATLQSRGLAWVDDPSNQDMRAQRARVRAELADPAEDGLAASCILRRAGQAGMLRAASEAGIAGELASRVTMSPLGYAVISPGPLQPASLAAIWQAISGRDYPPPRQAIARLADAPRPATLCGVRMVPAGRLGPGWLLVGETPSAPVQAQHGARWDRFVLDAPDLPADLTIAAGDHPAHPALPASIRRALPALWRHGAPYVHCPKTHGDCRFRFMPAVPAAGGQWIGEYFGVSGDA